NANAARSALTFRQVDMSLNTGCWAGSFMRRRIRISETSARGRNARLPRIRDHVWGGHSTDHLADGIEEALTEGREGRVRDGARIGVGRVVRRAGDAPQFFGPPPRRNLAQGAPDDVID